MSQMTGYPSCCSANAVVQFGQNFDNKSVQSVKQIKEDVTNGIAALKRAVHHTVVTAIIIRKQVNAKQALEELGFKAASGWMLKPSPITMGEEEYIKTIVAQYADRLSKYEQDCKKGYIGHSDMTYYRNTYSEANAVAYAKRNFEDLKNQEDMNYERATMLFYLPLVGEE